MSYTKTQGRTLNLDEKHHSDGSEHQSILHHVSSGNMLF